MYENSTCTSMYEYIYASVVLHTIRRKLVGDSGKDVKQLFF